MKKDSDGPMFTEAISSSEKETLLFDMECRKMFYQSLPFAGGEGGGEEELRGVHPRKKNSIVGGWVSKHLSLLPYITDCY